MGAPRGVAEVRSRLARRSRATEASQTAATRPVTSTTTPGRSGVDAGSRSATDTEPTFPAVA